MDDGTPGHLTNHDLTLRIIWLTAQRARAAQREQSGLPPLDPLVPSSPALRAVADNGDAVLDPALDAALDADPGLGTGPGAVPRSEVAPLPHPMRTTAKLGHYLEVATAERPGDQPPVSVSGRLGSRLGLAGRQVRFNAAVIEVLHQLDHRTQAQARIIAALEAELIEARRAIAALEAQSTGGTRAAGATGTVRS
jgi:hypothetical protein